MRPGLSPKRSLDHYRQMMLKMNDLFKSVGATQGETVILTAQFLGLVIAEAPIEAQKAQLEVAERATKTAYAGKVMSHNTTEYFKDRGDG